MADVVTDILRAASKHPNSRVSKLIHTVEEEPSQKNIVMLLIELAEHAEYSIDFNISLKYYLDLFESLGINHDLVLNEAGLLLVNSSKIYSKRIDYVQSLVERQILTLSNADVEIQQQNIDQQQDTQNGESTPAEKPKRGRKRALEVPNDPYEIELAPKKFKKLTEEKRFSTPKQTSTKPKLMQRNIEMEQHIHPAGWLHAAIYDFENEEDVDTKRNYKLFTYHIEHRYNTLVPDINFRLHFKVKDYMDEQEEMEDAEACNTDRSWPPLSEAYVQKYISLENYVLQQEAKTSKRKHKELRDAGNCNLDESSRVNNSNYTEDSVNNTNEQLITSNANDTLSKNNDTGLGESLIDESNKSLSASQLECTPKPLETTSETQSLSETTSTEINKSLNAADNPQDNDSALCSSVLDHTNTTEMNTTSERNETQPSENLSDISLIERQQMSGITECSSFLDQSKSTDINTTSLEQSSSGNFNSTTLSEGPEANDSSLSTSAAEQTKTTDPHTTTEESSINSHAIIEAINISRTEISAIADASDQLNNETTIKVEEESKLGSQDAENCKEPQASLTEKTDKINLKDNINKESEKDPTQLKVQMPHNDDEGVYLSDLEEQDCRLLSPVIKTVNILPGVVRKDVTIYMDEELRTALDMRDGIMDHFGTETYKIPIITPAKKQDLIFNVLKLPEKLLRKRILFKLPPEMDLFLQARCLKRSRSEPASQSSPKFTRLKWYSLNDTDMSGVCMTPPYSPGHCSDFYGFTDDDNTICSGDFCGFTEEEQAALEWKITHRLSRDSGVGVDANNLTPDKESMEFIFKRDELLKAFVNNCEKHLLNDGEPNETIENLLNQLPSEIRDVLKAELDKKNENEMQQSNGSLGNNTKDNSDENEYTDNTTRGSELTSSETTNICNTDKTETTATTQSENPENSSEIPDVLSTENISKFTENSNTEITMQTTEMEATENISITIQETERTEMAEQKEANESPNNNNNNENIEKNSNSQAEVTCDKFKNNESSDNAAIADVLGCENSVSDNDDSQDDMMLDLNIHGVKTKIQQWHEHLQPILAKSRERHHFDVFQLGTEIIDTINENSTAGCSSPPIATFQNIMDNREQSYVSRYFLSTLLLANQNNVEISIKNKSSEKPSSWQDINLKLLTTKRHTVAIEDNIGLTRQTMEKQPENSQTMKTNDGNIKPLVKLDNKTKSSLKRNLYNSTSTPFKVKKTDENSISELIQSIEYIPPSTSFLINGTPLSQNITVPSTSHKACHVNLNAIQTLQPIEKTLANQNIQKYFPKIKKLPV